MFGWLRKWFSKPDDYEIYAPGERMIYSYWNGQEQVKADPLVLFQRLAAKGGDLAAAIRGASTDSSFAAKAHADRIRYIRDIFSLKPFEENGGLTELECCNLLDHFLTYVGRLKKKLNPSWTPSNNSADSSSTSAEGQTTQPSLPSGSAEKESCIEEPTSSVPESPSVCTSSTQE